MTAQMHKLAEQQEFERAQEIKTRIKSLDLLQQEQSFNSALTSIDFLCAADAIFFFGITEEFLFGLFAAKIFIFLFGWPNIFIISNRFKDM